MKKLTLNSIKWMAIHFSAFMMAFAPVVDGFAAENAAKELNEARVKAMMMDLGMTKSQTLGSFYAKNKSQFPPRIQNLIADLFAKHKNEKMPMFEVATAKSADGQTVPVIRAQIKGMLFNVEVHNNDKFFAKIGQTELTNIDINNFTDMFEKMYRNDYNFRRWADSQKVESTGLTLTTSGPQTKNEFSLPEIDKETWKKLTPEGRVQYILNMRQMWADAMNVLMMQAKGGTTKPSKGKKTSSSDLMEEIWKLLNADADAQPAPPVGREVRNAGQVEGTDSKVHDSSCLLAGYVDDYKKGKCDADNVIARYKGDSIISTAQAQCASGEIACNPMIYGMPKDGKANCITISNDRKSTFQKATHWSGPCDPVSRLSTNEVSFLVNDKLTGKERYADANYKLKQDQIIEVVRKEQEVDNYKLTKDFLSGVMKSRDEKLQKMFLDGKIDDDVLKLLIKIKKDFDDGIGEARLACTTSAKKGRLHEPNFWGACDQMHRRELFVGDYLRMNVSCKDDAGFNMKTYKCECPVAKFGKDKVVFPGQACQVSTSGNPGGEQCTAGSPAERAKCGAAAAGKCPAEGKMPDGKACTPLASTLCEDAGFIVKETGDRAAHGDAAIMCVCTDGKGQPSAGNVGATYDQIKSGKFKKDQCPGAGGLRPSGTGTAAVTPAADSGSSCAQAKEDACNANVDKKGKKTHDWLRRTSDSGAEACDCRAKKDSDEEGSWWKDNKENVYMAGVLGAFVLLMLKTAPKKPVLNPPGDLCTSGQASCPGVCPKVNQVKVNGVCQCREPSPLEVVINAAECEYGPKTGTATTLTCPDSTTKVSSITECPKQTCSDASTVYVGQSCPTESPATKPTNVNPTDVKR